MHIGDLLPSTAPGLPTSSPGDQSPVAADPELRVLQPPGTAHQPPVAHHVPQALAGAHAEEASVLGDEATGRDGCVLHSGAALLGAASGSPGLQHRESAQRRGDPCQVAGHRAAPEVRHKSAHGRSVARARGRGRRRPALVLAAAGAHPGAVPRGTCAREWVRQQQVIVAGNPAGDGAIVSSGWGLCPRARRIRGPQQVGPGSCTHPELRLHHATPIKPSSEDRKSSPRLLGAAILDWGPGHVGQPHVTPG